MNGFQMKATFPAWMERAGMPAECADTPTKEKLTTGGR